MAMVYKDGPSYYGFLANPRTGSRSIRQLLQRLGWRRDGPHHARPSRPVKHSFCVVRHHADALVSWSHHLSRPLEDADDLVELIAALSYNSYGGWWNLSGELFPFASGTVGSPDVLRYERLEEEVGDWLEGHGFTRLQLPHVGRSDRKPWAEVFTVEMLEVLEDYYVDEMERLGYRI
ncbi:MAG: hypothetical protein ACLFWG_10155 [Longimicrobiales bacterium]